MDPTDSKSPPRANPTDGESDAIGLALTDALAHNLLDSVDQSTSLVSDPADNSAVAMVPTHVPVPVFGGNDMAASPSSAPVFISNNNITTQSLDPAIEALVNHLVHAKLHDTQLQFDNEIRNWRSKEAALITRDINTRKALEELKTKLALSEQKASGALVSPANAPRKRRRRSTASVQDVPASSPARNTRSIHRQLTLEAAMAATATQPAMPGTILNEPNRVLVDGPQPMEDVNTSQNPDHSAQNTNLQNPVGQPHVPSDTISPVETAHTHNTRRQHRSSQNNGIPLPQPTPIPRPRRTREPHIHSTLPDSAIPQQTAPLPSRQTRPTARVRASASNAPPTNTISTVPITHSSTQPPQRKSHNVVKSANEIYRFLPQDMPDDVDGLKKAMDIHCRILWGLLDAKAVPQDPPAKLLNAFSARFSTETEIRASQECGPELLPLNLIRIGTLISSNTGRIARHARLVEENMLSYIQVRLSRLGFDQWCPDLRQTPYALFNAACRIVALDTFRQALVSNTYQHLQPNLSYTQNMDLLVKLYDHFVFHYMYLRYKKESRVPGSVEQHLMYSPVYQNRLRLANARTDFLRENGYPKRYLQLIDPKATSDDELDEGGKIFWIKRRPERSAAAEQFFRILDAKREEFARQTKSRKWRERTRLVPTSGQKDSTFHIIASNMPIDYFDPSFFNRQQPSTRNRIAMRQVALLPDVANSLTWCSDERLSDSVFMRKYGRQIVSQYNMVRDTDLAVIQEESVDSLDSEERIQLGEDEGEGDWIDTDEAWSEDFDDNGTAEMSISSSSQSSTNLESESQHTDDDTTVVPPTGA